MFKLKSWTLLAGLVGLLALIAFTLWDQVGVLLVLGVAFAVNRFSLERGAALVLRMHRFRPLARWEAPHLYRSADQLADRDAAQLSRDPRGLASALDKIAAHGREMTRWYRRFRFIYTAPPERGSTWLRTHPKTEERIRDLLELEGAAREHPAGEPIRQRPLPAKTVFAAAKSGVRRAPREIEVKMPPSIFSGRHSHRLRPRYWWQGPVVVHVRTAGQFGTVSIAR